MTKKVKTVLLLLLGCSFSAFAQEAKKTKGYQGIIEIGASTLIYDHQTSPILLKADFINGYKFNPSISAGIGIGIILSPSEIGNEGAYILPLYGNFRANLFYHQSTKVFPYIQTGAGLAFVPGSDEHFFILRQAIGIGFKKSPAHIGLIGEMFRANIAYEKGGKGHHSKSIFCPGIIIGFSF